MTKRADSLTGRLRTALREGPPRTAMELATLVDADRDTVRGLLQVLRDRGEARCEAVATSGPPPSAFGFSKDRQVWLWGGVPAVTSKVLGALQQGPLSVAELAASLGSDAAVVRGMLLEERAKGRVASRLSGGALVWALTAAKQPAAE